MERDVFEKIVECAFDRLPENFKEGIDNVGIVVEDYPSDEIIQKMGLASRNSLLGLYQGVPRPFRNTWYGTSPVVPDRISIYKRNIEMHHQTDEEIERAIYNVLIHEIGHYFGMSEEEIRSAGY